MTLLWKPTLAATLPPEYDLNTLPYPLYASSKLDGVRSMVQNGVLVSRNGRPISNRGAQAMYGASEYEGFDGELVVGAPYGPDVFNRTVRVTQSHDASVEGLTFYVFDVFCAEHYAKRMQYLADRRSLRSSDIHYVEQSLVRTSKQLLAYEQRVLRAGYEGVMLRRTDAGAYMQKRSTLREFSLVKLKRFEYGEARILDIVPLTHNNNEERTATGRRSSKKVGIAVDASKIGSALLEDVKTKVRFSVKVGTDSLQSWDGWAEESEWSRRVVRYKYQPTGVKDAPRFPTCEFKELL